MDTIFFEKQIGRLCAQHALNMLLQEPAFQPDDLALVAQELDNREKEVLAPALRATFQSQNFDDSGFFSIQVIQMALQKFQLRVLPLDNRLNVTHSKPSNGLAYICNLQEHWFAARRFNHHWFILDSLRQGPQYFTDSHLDHYFAQITQEGYSIFAVDGQLPPCAADLIDNFLCTHGSDTLLSNQEEQDIAKAINMSLTNQNLQCDSMLNEDLELQKALQASLEEIKAEHETEQLLLDKAIRLSLAGKKAKPELDFNDPDRPCSSQTAIKNCKARIVPKKIEPSAPPLSSVTSNLDTFSPSNSIPISQSQQETHQQISSSLNSTTTDQVDFDNDNQLRLIKDEEIREKRLKWLDNLHRNN